MSSTESFTTYVQLEGRPPNLRVTSTLTTESYPCRVLDVEIRSVETKEGVGVSLTAAEQEKASDVVARNWYGREYGGDNS